MHLWLSKISIFGSQRYAPLALKDMHSSFQRYAPLALNGMQFWLFKISGLQRYAPLNHVALQNVHASMNLKK